MGRADIRRVGGENASLGEMVRHLGAHGVAVPPRFATMADVYWHFVDANGLRATIATVLQELAAGKATLAETGQVRTSPRRYGKRITDGERDLAGCGQSQEIRKGSERAAVADRCALNAEPRPVRCTPDDLQGVTAKRVGQPIDIVSIAILLYSQVLPEFRPPHLVLF